ncbi:MAG TPA: PVC-type heme-binding CxxCH protein, partial [Planctomycetaceae bacterium]|nr:PVC-type heme-binding CxxCH protein [Planctomycetaceae bacterium]
VITNKPGAGPNGTHLFLTGEEALSKMTIGKGLKINLFASEEKFPELIQPVQMAWDTKGRLWVAIWPSYPHWKPKDEMNDKLLILEDTNGDGVADTCKTFADHLHNPTGFEFWNGGVLLAMAPDLVFLKDTDGDDKADVRQSILHGLDSADTHHTANSFTLDPGGALYFQEGVFHRTQSETPYGPIRNFDACVWRFEPRTYKFERYSPYGFANPHGHSFDRWGVDIIHDGTGAQPYHGAVISSHLDQPGRRGGAPQVYNQRTRPCPGTEFLSSRHFPDEFQDNLLVGNVIGIQGILRYRIDADGSSVTGTELEPIVTSSDPNFRPSDFEIGADGALYFSDWQNPIIGHM